MRIARASFALQSFVTDTYQIGAETGSDTPVQLETVNEGIGECAWPDYRNSSKQLFGAAALLLKKGLSALRAASHVVGLRS